MNDLETALDEIVTLRATISRIQHLHHIDGFRYAGCVQCRVPWPCPTITALAAIGETDK